MFSYDELMKKSVSELNAMLADDSLFPLDEMTDIIERICDVIIKKENVPNWILKAKSQKAWRRFKKKYITVDSETYETELIEVKRPKKQSFTPIFAALAAAIIVVFAARFPRDIPQKPAGDTPTVGLVETSAGSVYNKGFNATMYLNFGGIQWFVPGDYEAVVSDAIKYNDKSKKTYTIYSSGDKIFFIAVLTNISGDANAPSESQLDPFDIYTGTYLENNDKKKNENRLKSLIVENRQIIIDDEEPGSTIFMYNQGVFTYAHYT
jgi:hypothetical protein